MFGRYTSIRDELRSNLRRASDYFLSHINVLLPPSSSSARMDVEHSSRRWNDESDSESSIGDNSLNQVSSALLYC